VFSFLDKSENTDLIRWSDSGDSFIVLDEDEFAKTLIPELFKHNNYASFVRQLNMYGFHKKVGLSDNSMRASERKNKSPSEYYNPYFKRGKPELLWLIQKPRPPTGKSKGGTKLKHDDNEVDEDGEEPYEAETSTSGTQKMEETGNVRQPLLIGNGGGSLRQADLVALQHEIHQIRQQHRMISGVIHKITQDHQNLYAQAATFQEQHNRHENSINAILTFLATVYNRSLEGDGAQNIQNLFAGAIPADMQRQGSVVDVGDYNAANNNIPNSQLRRPMRRTPLLIGAPPISSKATNPSVATATMPVARDSNQQARVQNLPSPAQTPNNLYSSADSLRPGQVHEIFNTPSPNSSSESPRFTASSNTGSATAVKPERDIMSFINSANANDANLPNNNRMDFPQALSHLENADGKSPLTENQRNSVLQLMANGSAKSPGAGNTINNALTLPSPPTVPLPGIPQWNATQKDLEFLQKTLKEQDEKVQNLSSLLQPLSPSGTIPGLNDPLGYTDTGPVPTDPLDFDAMFNSGDYFGDTFPASSSDIPADMFPDETFVNNGTAAFEDFNIFDPVTNNGASGGLDLDGAESDSGHHSERTFETVDTSEGTSPANTIVNDTAAVDAGIQDEGKSPRKRRRRN
jgi:heat shock transcription factor